MSLGDIVRFLVSVSLGVNVCSAEETIGATEIAIGRGIVGTSEDNI